MEEMINPLWEEVHAEQSWATRRKESAGHAGPDETAPCVEVMCKLVVEEVVTKTLLGIVLKDGERALPLVGDFAHLHINPSGKLFIGGFQVGAGLIGRLITGARGGSAFSGKDPTEVD